MESVEGAGLRRRTVLREHRRLGPLRVVLELIPEKTIKFDGDHISQASYDGVVPGHEK